MAYTITEAQAAELLKIADTLVGKQIKGGLIPESDRDDYIQELMLIMVEHQNDWTVPDGVRFESYANTVMEKRLISIWRKKNVQKDVLNNALSLNATFIDEDEKEEEFVNRLTEDGMMANDAESSINWSRGRYIAEIRLFVATLPEDERELCETLMHYNKVETARILGKHKQTIWRMMDRIRKKMLSADILPPSKKKSEKLEKGCDLFSTFLR